MAKIKNSTELAGESVKIGDALRKFAENGRLCAIEKDILMDRLRSVYEFLSSDTGDLQPVEGPSPDGAEAVRTTDATSVFEPPAPDVAGPKSASPMEEAPAPAPSEPSNGPETFSEKVSPLAGEPEIPFSFQPPLERSVIDALYGDQTLVKKPESLAASLPEPEIQPASEPEELPTPSDPELPALAQEPTHQTLNDVLASESPTAGRALNDAIGGESHPSDVASVLSSQSVSELRRAVGLNDKFLLLNDVFQRDESLYDAAMEKLEEFGTFEDACIFLQENFQLDPSKEGAQLLISLLERKFS